MRGIENVAGGIRWVWLVLLGFASLAFVAVLVLFHAGQGKVRTALLTRLAQATGRECALDALALDPLGRLTLRNLRCGEALAVQRGELAVDWQSSLTTRSLRLLADVDGLDVDFGLMAPGSVGGEEKGGAPHRGELFLGVPLSLMVTGRHWHLRFPYGQQGASLQFASLSLECELRSAPTLKVDWRVAGGSVRWERGPHGLTIQKVEVHGEWDPQASVGITFGRLRSSQGAVMLRRIDSDHMRVYGKIDAVSLAAFSDDIPVVRGTLSGIGQLYGPVVNPVVDFRFFLTNGSWEKIEGADLRGRFVRQGPELRFERVRLRHATLRASGDVAFDLGDHPKLTAAARGGVSSPGNLARLVGLRVPQDALQRLNFSGEILGPLKPLQLQWSAAGRTRVRVPVPLQLRTLPIAWNATGQILPHEGGIQIAGSALGAVEFKLEHRWRENEQTGHGEIASDHLQSLASVLEPLGQRMGLTGRARVGGAWRVHEGFTVIETSLRLVQVSLLQSTVREAVCGVRAVGTPEWQVSGTCDASDQRGGHLNVSGVWRLGQEPETALQVNAKDFSAEFLTGASTWLWGDPLPVSRGRVSGELSLRQRRSSAELDLQAVVNQFRIWQEPITSFRCEARYRTGEWRVAAELSRRDGKENLHLNAEGKGNVLDRAALRGDPIRLDAIVGLGRRGVGGQLTVAGEWSGPLFTPRGNAEVVVQDLRVDKAELASGKIHIDFEPKQWTIQGDALDQKLQLRGTVDPRQGYRFDVAATAAQIQVVAPHSRIRIETAGQAVASGRLAQPRVERAEIKLNRFVLAREPYRLEATIPFHLQLDGDTFRLDPWRLESDGSKIEVAAKGRIDGEMEAEIHGTSDLVLLELLGEPILEASGAATIGARIERRSLGEWQAQGSLAVKDGILEIEGFPPLSAIRGHATLQNESVRDVVIEAVVGDGKLSINGQAGLYSGPALSWTLHDVAGSWGDDLQARLSGRGELTGTWDNLSVAGDLQVLNAVYDRDLALGDLLRWLRDRLFAPRRVQTVMRTPVGLDLKIHSPGHVFLDNNIAKVEFWLDLWVGGTIGRPLVGGRIGVLDGEVTFQGRTFTITAGTLEFRDPASLNPWLDFVAETRVATPQAEYLVTAQVTGQADRPRVQFSADDPSLAPEDILSLLATGRTRAMVGQTGGFSPAGAAFALLPKREAEQRVQRWLGVDRFELSATQARDTGTVEPRVTVGKELSERFYASASTSVGAQARQTVQLEYRLTRRVSLLGGWESATHEAAGAFSGDLKFRVEFLRAPFSLACP
ncbi:MAG: translocation/assembly module TamB [Candidatus Binatia bacterium]|nr:translocation/assembly module TamB [Candidatus Binatia bacterium]